MPGKSGTLGELRFYAELLLTVDAAVPSTGGQGKDVIAAFLHRSHTAGVGAFDHIDQALGLFGADLVHNMPVLNDRDGDFGVKIAIENCPMFYTKDEWPGGTNLACSPYIWRTMFERMPFGNFGLNYDPSHMLLQGADYIRPVYEFKEKIFHVHIKDIKMYPDKIYEYGMFGYPSRFHSPKVPGLGDIDWGAFMSALYDIRYEGAACLEIEDKAFEDSEADILRSIRVGAAHVGQFYQK